MRFLLLRGLSVAGLFLGLASCVNHAASPAATPDQEKKQEAEAEEREREYNQFVVKLRELVPGRTTAEEVTDLLGRPAFSGGNTCVYELRLAPSSEPERFTLAFRNGVLTGISSSGMRYYQAR